MMFYVWVLIKFAVGFLIIITHMNLSGKTQLSQMTPVDFIGNFVLGAALGGVVYSDTIPFHEYLLVLLMGVAFISVLNYLTKRFSAARTVAIGDPIPIVKNGRLLVEKLISKSNKLDILNICTLMHAQGILSFQEIHYAQIEPNGMLTAFCYQEKMPSTILMNGTNLRSDVMKEIGRDDAWLENEIQKKSLDRENIFIVELWRNTLYFVLKDGKVLQTEVF